jgi:ADP-ribosylglycohydrolase
LKIIKNIMTHQDRLKYAQKSLLGISLGDAFGDSFFGESRNINHFLINRTIPESDWGFTDDTVMGIGIYQILAQFGEIRQAELAQIFAENYQKDRFRGYGGTAHRILREIGEGNSWQEVSANAFEGMGSMGNGAAMRVAPIGAYFWDDFIKVKEQAELSAEVTHFNLEAKTGAIAIALASAIALRINLLEEKFDQENFIHTILNYLPDTDTKSKIAKVLTVPANYHIETVTRILGNGLQMTAQDTIPFTLWCIIHHFQDFNEGLWTCVAGLGDMDTNCAIVGSVLILAKEKPAIALDWIQNVEKWEGSIFY